MHKKQETAARAAKIKKQLHYGDITLIAEMTGYSPEYVRRVFTCERNSEDILQAAEMLLYNREQLRRDSLAAGLHKKVTN